MRNLFETPEMHIAMFEAENVVTVSGELTSEQNAETNIKAYMSTNSITLTGEIIKFNQ